MATTKPIEIASYKLTNWDRDAIQKRAIEAAFDKEEAALTKRENDLCRRCYNQVIPADIRKKVAALPADWFRLDTRPHFSIGGLHMTLVSVEPLRVPSGGEGGRIGTIKDRDLIEAVHKLVGDKEDFTKRRSMARNAIKALLYSVTTSRKLIDAWPEAKPFLQGIGVAVENKVPAAQIQELNVMLGLKAA